MFCLNYLLSGCRVLELGSGSGLVGTLLAGVGAQQVLLTDGNTDALDNCIRNLVLNGCEPCVVDSYEEAQSSKAQV